MCPIRQGAEAGDELRYEPEADQEHCGDAWQQWNGAEKHERADARAAEENQIRSQNTGDSAACSDARYLRLRVNRDLGEPGNEPAQKIEDDVAHMPKGVLDVIAEDPEVNHIQRNVEEPAV